MSKHNYLVFQSFWHFHDRLSSCSHSALGCSCVDMLAPTSKQAVPLMATPLPARRCQIVARRPNPLGRLQAGGRQRVVGRLSCRAASEGAVKTANTVPKGPKDQVEQAAAACERAFRAGHSRQKVELLLPLIGATDIDDWPGGIRQQFKAAAPLVEQLLQSLRQLEGLQGGLKGEILDEGDAVGAWVGKTLAAVLFPTADTLKQVRSIAEGLAPSGLTLLVNPQWRTEGQVIPDFGILPWQRKAAEELVGSFTEAYALKQLRINGDEVRLLRAFPGDWQVFVARGLGGEFECVLEQPEPPSYQQLDSLLRSLPWTQSSKPLLKRVNDEMQFLQRSLEAPPQNQQQQD